MLSCLLPYFLIFSFEKNSKKLVMKLLEKVIILISLLRVDKSLCLPKLKSITVLLYDFSFKNENFATQRHVQHSV